MNIGMANDYAGYLPPAKLFPLGGYTTWRARTSCLEVDAETHVVNGVAELVHGLAARHFQGWAQYAKNRVAENGTATAETVRHDGPNTALSADASLAHFQMEPFQRIELAAAEPQAIDPVAMRFDDAGDMWIVEMSDYPNPVAPNAPPLGRVRVLHDEDLDGRYESVQTFAEGLLMPTGLQFFRDGLLVTVGGQCVLLRDTDGDGRADTTDVIAEGFAVENPQLRVNDPDIGPDLQLYLANGLRSSRIDVAGTSLAIGSSDVRWDPRSKQAHAITGPSQFGMAWDRFGNRYFCSNRNP
jgi:glucose/arabinose dehydrogenase